MSPQTTVEERLAVLEAEVAQLKQRLGPPERKGASWKRFRGKWQADDPVVEEWRRAVEEYRQQMEDDPNVR
jgi:hypothetical protein